MYDLEESGQRIKELRKKKGITQEALAEEIGVARKIICYIENGVKSTTIDNFSLIAEHLNSSIDYIVRGANSYSGVSTMIDSLNEEKRESALRMFKGIVDNL